MINMRRKIARFRSMDWPDRRERIGWYLRRPFVVLLRAALIGLYYPLALVLSRLNVRFLVSQVVNPNFGHLAHEPQLYLKAGLLGAHPQYHAVFLAPPWDVANQALLDCWRDHMTVVANPVIAAALMPLRWIGVVNYQIYPSSVVIRDRKGEMLSAGAALDEIGAQFEAMFDGRPLVTVKGEHRARGLERLRRLGMPEDAWWSCLHVREPGYHPQSENMNLFRDADPLTYLEAVDAIVDRGGWVIRTGDPSMTPLPPREGLIDYVHSDERADWMDLFLIADCRFLLAADSGPPVVALMFSRPVAGTNWIPMGHGAHGSTDLYIPKLYWSESEDRFLRFDEVLSTDARNWGSSNLFREHGVRWQDNSPAEIRQLVDEMMDRLDGNIEYSDEDERLQSEYKGLLSRNRTWETYGLNSRIGREFIRSHRDLLPEPSRIVTATFAEKS